MAVPGAPTGLRVRDGTLRSTSFGVEYERGSSPGLPLLSDEVQWRLTFGSDTPLWTDTAATGYSNSSGGFTMTPGTRYSARARSRNSDGWGAWSSWVAEMAAYYDPPTLVVARSPDGTSATITVTPPVGVTPSRYDIQGGLSPDGTEISASSVTNGGVFTVTGLVAGRAYRWRARVVVIVFFVQRLSAWSGWLNTAAQAVGPYFDGDTPDTETSTYSWQGTPHQSASIRTSASPAGWLGWAEASLGAGGSGVVTQVLGGRFGLYGAAAIVLLDTTAAGVTLGVGSGGAGEALPGSTYYGSLYVALTAAAAHSMTPGLRWEDSGGNLISYSWGAAASVPADGEYVRLVTSAVAPAGTASASPVVRDSATGWVPFEAGDVIHLDGAALYLDDSYSYFDGDTPDTETSTYSWQGTPHQSASIRTSASTTTVDPGVFLQDPDCPRPPLPPAPPGVPADCVEDVGSWRRRWIVPAATDSTAWMESVLTIRVTAQSVALRQIRLRTYENPEGLPPEQFNPEGWNSDMILSYVPPLVTITLNSLDGSVTAINPEDGTTADASHLLYGSNGGPPRWPSLTQGVPYLVSVDVPDGSPEVVDDIEIDQTLRYQ